VSVEISIEPVPFEQKGVLRRLLQFYLYDFSEIEPENVRMGADGEFPYRYLDHYWAPDAGEERYPYFIRADGELAGFALVRKVNGVFVMTEFFVLRPFRRTGTGSRAASAVLRQHPGSWIVQEVAPNVAAQAFWRRVIAEVTGGEFTEERSERGVTQRFVIGEAGNG
jgi:predicted acetyltransferase